MASRLELHEVLCGILNNNNCYFQPPSNVQMQYPAIVYSTKKIDGRYANDKMYSKLTCYELTLIDKNPDSEFIDKLLSLPYCSFDRPYDSDNLHHYVFTLYY